MREILKIVNHIYLDYALGLMEDTMKESMIWARKMGWVSIDFKMGGSTMENGKMEDKMGKGR
jgi:hypothetical protein